MKAVADARTTSPASNAEQEQTLLVRRHLRFGWWSLLAFLVLGLALETFHGRKAGFYLDVSNSTRRLMWTLAHAHGTVLAVVHIAFAITVSLLSGWGGRPRGVASALLMSATLLIPVGFFLGGIVVYGGDPGLGILLVPLGAILLFCAVGLVARAATVSAAAAEPAKGRKART